MNQAQPFGFGHPRKILGASCVNGVRLLRLFFRQVNRRISSGIDDYIRTELAQAGFDLRAIRNV